MTLPDSNQRPPRDDAVFPRGLPIACDLARSSGAYLADARSGKDLLDFVGHATMGPLGYNHPKMKGEAFIENLEMLALHMPVNCETHRNEYGQFSETFDIVPLGGQFANLVYTAGEHAAVETAIKTAISWKHQKNILAKSRPRRSAGQILHFRRGFQGRFGLALSLTDLHDSPGDQWAPRLKWPRVDSPAMTFPFDDQARTQLEEREAQVLAQIHQAYERAPGEIAGVLLEPIQAEGGDNFFRSEFLRMLRDLCDERNSLLIFDETLTGFGVTGVWWDWQNHDVKPDLLIFGGRAQVCGVAGTERLDEVGRVLQECSDNGRFAGNILNMVRSQQTIEIIRELELLTNARNMGAYMLKLISELPASAPEVSNVRGRGVWVSFDLPSESDRNRLVWACFEEELLVGAAGDRTIRLRPGLDVNADAVGRAVAQLEAGLRRAYKRKP
jgi:L-lysine 6-transaminase